MKNIFKFLMMGLMLIAFTAGAAQTGFSQTAAPTPRELTPEQQTEKEGIYKRFLDNRKGPKVEQFKIAAAAGDEFLQKYGDDAEIVAYINKLLPQIKKAVEGDVSAEAATFNKAVPAKSWDEAFTSGKAILAKSPDNIDIMLVLAAIGFDNASATPPVDKYNADAVNFAKTAIRKLEEGKPSSTGNFGAFDNYSFKDAKYTDGKSNAIGYMNYTIGYIMFNRLNQKKEALPYLYKATQTAGLVKDSPDVYQLIGSYYRDEYNRIVADRAAKIAANGNKETPETRDALGMQYAYADRAINAYSTAYKVANANPLVKEPFKKGVMDTAKLFYKARFEKEDGSDAYIATESAKPLIDPATPVTAVAVESIEPTTPATTGTPTTTRTPKTTPATTPKPATPKATTTTTPAAPTAKPSPSATPKKP